MDDEVKQEIKQEAGTSPAKTNPEAPLAPAARRPKNRNFNDRRPSRKGSREDRVRPEFDQKLLAVRRVARVAAGGRRFNFSVALVLGNRKGSVSVATGKGADTALAIDKATRAGKKHLFRISLTKSSSIPYPISAKYCSAEVILMPAPGRGLIAGSSVRDVLELGGVRDVSAKILSGSKNKLNNARAALEALKKLARAEHVSASVPVAPPAPESITEMAENHSDKS